MVLNCPSSNGSSRASASAWSRFWATAFAYIRLWVLWWPRPCLEKTHCLRSICHWLAWRHPLYFTSSTLTNVVMPQKIFDSETVDLRLRYFMRGCQVGSTGTWVRLSRKTGSPLTHVFAEVGRQVLHLSSTVASGRVLLGSKE
ncbi:hypothetical protein LX36DRAFT_16163 [Colletotrichum falcatum]|nr:hypothetical protein LX36DRAFT_16163 [Colletotrichum falcatum]